MAHPFGRPCSGNRMILDFRSGRNSWGHAIHGNTFGPESAPSLIERLRDWWDGAYRASVLCHHPHKPVPGDVVQWTAARGDCWGEIYRVETVLDPNDMHKIFLRILAEGES